MANLNFHAGNGITFIVNNDPASGNDEGSFKLDWDSEGGRFAEKLRALADWLDEHPEDNIEAEVD